MCKGYCNSGECQGEKSWEFSLEKATDREIVWQQYYPKRKARHTNSRIYA